MRFDAVSSSYIRIDGFENPGSIPDVPSPVPLDPDPIVGMDNSLENIVAYYGEWEVVISLDSVILPRIVISFFEELEARVRINATSAEVT